MKGFLRILFRRRERRKILPSLSFPSVATIPFARYLCLISLTISLKQCGVKAVIFDKDNTLTPPYSFSMNESTERAVRNCQQLFGYDRVVIFSNSAGSRNCGGSQPGSEDDRGYLHAEAIEEEMHIKVIRHRQKKPEGLLEAICEWDSVQPSEVMMVGDRYLTDIYGGNLLGMLTVAVEIFTEVNDNKGAILGRRVERMLLRLCSCTAVQPLFQPIAARYLESVLWSVSIKHKQYHKREVIMEPSECSHSPFCFTAFRHSGQVSSFSNHWAMQASQNTCPHDSLIGHFNSSMHTEHVLSRSDCSDTDSPYICE